MAVWQEKKLGEVAEIVSGGTPDTNNFEFWGGNIGWITPFDLSNYNYRYICNGTRNITDSGLANSSAKLLPSNTILFSSRAPIGYIAIAKNPLTTNQGFKNLICKNINYLFLYYYLKYNVNYLKLYATGATFPELSATTIKKIKINIPDLVTQEKIADILSTYDDLIENNNRRIEILEQMAQEIYKEWFVRFRFPGHEKVKFINGLPEGWEVKKIGDIASIKSGYAFKSSWWQEEGIPVIKIKDIQNNGIDTNNFAYVSEIHMEKAKQFIAEPGDIVIALTGATIGKIGLIPFYHKPLLINQRVGKFFCGEKPILNNGYLYILLQQNWIKDLIFMISSSSAAQPNISPNDIEEIKILYNKNIIEQFNQKISDYILQILKLKNINQNLIKQRDLLLPRLMSGKLEV